MSRESIYKRYVPSFAPEVNEDSNIFWFVFNSDNLLIDLEKNCKIPFIKDLKVLNILPIRTLYMGTFLGHACYSAEVAPETNAPESMAFMDLRHLYEILEEDLFLLAGRAIQIVNWDKNHSFCGKCGTHTEIMDTEMAKICPECGFISHTRIVPAVITAIIKDEKLLMAKHSYGLKNMYGLVAGFIEAGETLEEGVQREIMEEVGLKVKDIKYFGSQPWPFPNSLMIGFTATYESGEIKVDGNEILEAKWFDIDEVPRTHSNMSIASDLINWYIGNYSK